MRAAARRGGAPRGERGRGASLHFRRLEAAGQQHQNTALTKKLGKITADTLDSLERRRVDERVKCVAENARAIVSRRRSTEFFG